jgi:hypothetical protein
MEKKLTEDDIQQIKEVEIERQNLMTQLGMNRSEMLKLEQFEKSICSAFETQERERTAFHNRLRRKYGMSLTSTFDLSTGLINGEPAE